METTYKVRIWGITTIKGKRKTTYRVRWRVGTEIFAESFDSSALVESFRAKLLSAARNGEAFETNQGLPVSMIREQEVMKWFVFACKYMDMKWPDSSPKYRQSLAQSLTRITTAMLVDVRGLPEGKELRRALMAAFKTRNHDELPDDVARTLKEVTQASRNVGDLAEPDVLRSVLRTLDRNLNGKPAAADTARIRRVALSNAIEYAVEKKLLSKSPLVEVKTKKRKNTLKQVDPACVANPVQAAMLIDAVREVGKPGPPLVAFFGAMYYAALRPEEALNLKKDDLAIPPPRWDDASQTEIYEWGDLHLKKARPEVADDWSDVGEANEERSLKHRDDDVGRIVPCPPELTRLLHEHLRTFGTDRDGRLFRGARDGGRVGTTTYGRVWAKARQAVFTPDVVRGSLAKRPYDLRHAAVSTWLNGGVEPPRVAEWAGHSLAVLMRVYAKCLDGGEQAARNRVERALRGG